MLSSRLLTSFQKGTSTSSSNNLRLRLRRAKPSQSHTRSLSHDPVRRNADLSSVDETRETTNDVEKDDRGILAHDYTRRFTNVFQLIDDAKEIARRSILIEHNRDFSFDGYEDSIDASYTFDMSTPYGNIRFSMIEFKTQQSADCLANRITERGETLPLPTNIFRLPPERRVSSQEIIHNYPIYKSRIEPRSPNLESYASLLHSRLMSLAAFKLRFIYLVNIERILCSGPYSKFELLPSGSTLTGLASDLGDLDVVMTRKCNYQDEFMSLMNVSPRAPNSPKQQRSNRATVITDMLIPYSLVNFTMAHDKTAIRNLMRFFARIMTDYMPIIDPSSIQTIPHATVPLLAFRTNITNIECDMSFNLLPVGKMSSGLSGPIMSQVSHQLFNQNRLIAGLIAYFRLYSEVKSIKAEDAKPGITSFQLLSLLIFYLQNVALGKDGQLRPVEHDSDSRLCPPLSEILKRPWQDQSRVTAYSDEQLNTYLPQLIIGFFNYYSKFEFDCYSIDILVGCLRSKRTNNVVEVVNPFEPNRNVCSSITSLSLSMVQNEFSMSLQEIEAGRSPLQILQAESMDNNQSAPLRRKGARLARKRYIDGALKEFLVDKNR